MNRIDVQHHVGCFVYLDSWIKFNERYHPSLDNFINTGSWQNINNRRNLKIIKLTKGGLAYCVDYLGNTYLIPPSFVHFAPVQEWLDTEDWCRIIIGEHNSSISTVVKFLHRRGKKKFYKAITEVIDRFNHCDKNLSKKMRLYERMREISKKSKQRGRKLIKCLGTK
jgi:hypothetical protein